MASFYSGDQVSAVVADLGHYATKIGWAGDDYPKSYFRSNVAILREEAKKSDDSPDKRCPIVDVRYDYYTHPINYKDKSDGAWQVSNPVDSTTGLWYDDEHKTAGADWYDLMEILIRHGYKSALKSGVDKHPLMLVERSYNPPAIRQQVLECLFEEMDVPATFLAKDAVLACYGVGRTTGTVVDIGYSGTTVSPVYDGYVEQKGIRRSPAGVKAMDELLLEYLDQLHPRGAVMPLYQVRRPGNTQRIAPIHKASRLQLALECRETGAGAAINTAPGNSTFHAPHKPFSLPDGTVLDIPSAKRFAVADLVFGNDDASVQRREELLETQRTKLNDVVAAASQDDGDEATFSEAAAVGISKRRTKRGESASSAKQKPAATRPPFSNRHLQKACASHLQAHVDHLTAAPVANMICDAAYRCDRDQQAALLGNVVLGGGGACLGPTEQAVPDLVREQVEAIIHTHTPGWRVKLLTPNPQERSILSWLGGSILGSLGSFHDMWITRAEYDEWGTAIVNRKCP